MAMDFIGLSVGMGYTDETVIGGGALKGKNCVVSNIEEVADGVNVTFQWTLDNGTVQTETVLLPKGIQGEAGVAGKSAYEIWLEAGNTGTEEDFLSSLVGEKGADGTMTFEDLTEGQKESLNGEDGFSPTITENEDNTEDVYKLDIETIDGIFTTPNLKGESAEKQDTRKAIISIIDDDGSGYTEYHQSGMRTWLNNQGIPMAFALPMQVTALDPYIPDILATGNEIMPHGLTANDDYKLGYTDDMTAFENDVALSKTLAEQKGYTTNICVYPKGIQPNESTNYAEKLDIIKKYFDYGFNVNTAVESSSKTGFEEWVDSETKGRWNKVPFETMPDGFSKALLLNRLVVTVDENMQYSWWTKYIDNCIANKGYLTLFVHSHFDFLAPDENGHTTYSRFQDIINYVKENYADEVEFLTPSQAFEKLKTINDIASVTDKVDRLENELTELKGNIPQIDDNVISPDTNWSSEKIASEEYALKSYVDSKIADLQAQINALKS